MSRLPLTPTDNQRRMVSAGLREKQQVEVEMPKGLTLSWQREADPPPNLVTVLEHEGE